MSIAVSVKHGSTRYHTSMIQALFDYLDCAESTKDTTMWWVSDIETELLEVEDRISVLNSKDDWTENDLNEYKELRYRCIGMKQVQQQETSGSEPDEYTDAEALRDMTGLVAAITSGIKGAIAESEDQDLAHEVLDFIEVSISRRVN